MSFDGHLLYIQNRSNKNYEAFPNKYIQCNTYSSTPSQRLELKATRNSLAKLNRVTSPNAKTTISFQTHPLHLNEMEKVRNIFNNAFTNTTQRKLNIKYWNDEKMKYYTATVYMPDVTYTILDVNSTTNDIIYTSTTFEFIEY